MIAQCPPPQFARIFAWLLGLLAFTVRAELTTLETIELRYRTAAEVLPVVEPLIRGDGSVTGTRHLLFVRTTPENLAEVRRALDAIDTLARRLRITVLQNVDRAARERLLAAGGRGSADDGALEQPPRGRGGTAELARGDVSLRGQAMEREARERDRLTRHIRTLDGSPAFIVTGQWEPGGGRRMVRTPYGGTAGESAGNRDLEAGFYVLPRVSGGGVTLEITARGGGQYPPGAGDAPETSAVATGWLGEWIDVGAALRGRGAARPDMDTAGGSGGSESWTILLRIEEIR